MKFSRWKKELKKVHNNHVKNMVILNNPKTSQSKKKIAKEKLLYLEKIESNLEFGFNKTFSKTRKIDKTDDGFEKDKTGFMYKKR